MKTLKDLSIKELKDLYKENKSIQQKIFESYYEDRMHEQEEEARNIGAEVFQCNDHYTSFYLTTPKFSGAPAPEKVARHLRSEYLEADNEELYNKLNELMDKMEDAEEWDEDRPEYTEMIETCNKLAVGITEQLRAYEDIDEEELIGEFIFQAQNGFLMDMETDGHKVYETITKCYA